MEELDVEKTSEPKMWLRRGLVLSLMLCLAIALFDVLSIWSAGRLVLLTAGLFVCFCGVVYYWDSWKRWCWFLGWLFFDGLG